MDACRVAYPLDSNAALRIRGDRTAGNLVAVRVGNDRRINQELDHFVEGVLRGLEAAVIVKLRPLPEFDELRHDWRQMENSSVRKLNSLGIQGRLVGRFVAAGTTTVTSVPSGTDELASNTTTPF